MLTQISEALNVRLSAVAGSVPVFCGYAENQALPYVQFSEPSLTPEFENTGTTRAGRVDTCAMQIDTFYNSYASASAMLEKIELSLLSKELDVESASVSGTYTISSETTEEEANENTGERIYHGVLHVEFRLLYLED